MRGPRYSRSLEGRPCRPPTLPCPPGPLTPYTRTCEFSLSYMGFSTYRTGFRALEGTVRGDPTQPTGASVDVSIPVASVDVTNERLMGRLMDPDLLGGRDHPTITFRSTRVEPLDSTRWRVNGDLTIHGVSRPVVLDTRYLGQSKHPFSGKTVAAFRAETIDRPPGLRCDLERGPGRRRSLPWGAGGRLSGDPGGASGLTAMAAARHAVRRRRCWRGPRGINGRLSSRAGGPPCRPVRA